MRQFEIKTSPLNNVKIICPCQIAVLNIILTGLIFGRWLALLTLDAYNLSYFSEGMRHSRVRTYLFCELHYPIKYISKRLPFKFPNTNAIWFSKPESINKEYLLGFNIGTYQGYMFVLNSEIYRICNQGIPIKT